MDVGVPEFAAVDPRNDYFVDFCSRGDDAVSTRLNFGKVVYGNLLMMRLESGRRES